MKLLPWTTADKTEALATAGPDPLLLLGAYQAVVNLMTYEGTLIWGRFNAMLVANSLLLPAYALLITSPQTPRLLLVILPAAGLAICAPWFILTKRGFGQYRYWILSARQLEVALTPSVTEVLQRGETFARGNAATIPLGHGRQEAVQLPRLGRALTAARGSYLVIIVFVALYAAALAIAVAPLTATAFSPPVHRSVAPTAGAPPISTGPTETPSPSH